MRTVNIYALTRIKNIANLRRIERQMSGRNKMLTIKKWEFGSLTKLIDRLMEAYDGADRLNFFYSFQMPKLGKEFDLLVLLIEHRGIVLSREQLLDSIWKIDAEIESRTVDVHIRTLRQKIGDEDGQIIETVRGIGYKAN